MHTALPRMVIFDMGIASCVERCSMRMYSGTRMPPPPMPPIAATEPHRKTSASEEAPGEGGTTAPGALSPLQRQKMQC